MPDRKKFIAAVALSGSLLAGGAVGAALGAPSISGAQEQQGQSAADERPDRPGQHRGRHGGPRHFRAGLQAAAEALDMPVEELRGELREGRSIAQVAEARDVEVQAVIDAMVAAATENIEERITRLVNRTPAARDS